MTDLPAHSVFAVLVCGLGWVYIIYLMEIYAHIIFANPSFIRDCASKWLH